MFSQALDREFKIRAVRHCPLTSSEVYCRTLWCVIGAAHHLSPILFNTPGQAYKQVYCKPCLFSLSRHAKSGLKLSSNRKTSTISRFLAWIYI